MQCQKCQETESVMPQDRPKRKSRGKHDERWEVIIDTYSRELEHRSREIREAHPTVTMQESRIAALREKSLSNGEIAKLFGVEPSTVDNQMYTLRHKLGIKKHARLRGIPPMTPTHRLIQEHRVTRTKHEMPQIVSCFVR